MKCIDSISTPTLVGLLCVSVNLIMIGLLFRVLG